MNEFACPENKECPCEDYPCSYVLDWLEMFNKINPVD